MHISICSTNAVGELVLILDEIAHDRLKGDLESSRKLLRRYCNDARGVAIVRRRQILKGSCGVGLGCHWNGRRW